MSSSARWILIVLALLVSNALAMAYLVVASRRDPALVIPDYYERGIGAPVERSR
jgi:hypothetical protein